MAESTLSAPPRRPPLVDQVLLVPRRMSVRGWYRLDVMVAAATFAGLTIPALLGYPSREGAPAAVLLYGAGASLPLAVRRRWPLPVLALVVTSAAVGTAAGVRFTPFVSNAGPGVALALYTVAVRFDRRVSATALALAFMVGLVTTEIAYEAHPDQDHNAVHSVAALAGWVLGDVARTRRRPPHRRRRRPPRPRPQTSVSARGQTSPGPPAGVGDMVRNDRGFGSVGGL